MKHVTSLFDKSYNLKEGTIKINASNTLEHELAKSKLSILLKKQGKKFWTETIFLTKGRADIVTETTIYEILHSETKENILKKKDYYPYELILEAFTTKEILSKDFTI